MATYKLKDGTLTGFVPGVGPIVDGLLKDAPAGLENANLELVAEQTPPAPAAPAASPPPAPQSAAAAAPQPVQSNNQETN